MRKTRVGCYIDGFNIYHAIDDQNRRCGGSVNHLKWVDLWRLMREFTDSNSHEIVLVKLFTAFPVWNKPKTVRHKEFAKAQQYSGVEIITGRFKSKSLRCKICKSNYRAREEKESDVNLAAHLINDTHSNRFDQAFLVTNDSDLLGPVRMIRGNFPEKSLKIVAPPYRRHSKELWNAATHRTQIQQIHLEKCLLPQTALDASGKVIFRRPPDYDPPT